MISVPVAKYTIDPPKCEITYSCKEVVRTDGKASAISCSDFKVETDGLGDTSFKITADSAKYTDLTWEPATYKVTIEGLSVLSNDKATTEFNLVLTDPCNPPETLDAPTLPNQSYQITATEVSYQAPSFVTDPTYCINKVTYTSSVTPL